MSPCTGVCAFAGINAPLSFYKMEGKDLLFSVPWTDSIISRITVVLGWSQLQDYH